MITTKQSLALLLGVLVLVIGLFAGSCGTADPAAAQDLPTVCSNATLKGPYGVLEQGTIVEQLDSFPPPPFPLVLNALANFDGAGNFSVTYTGSFGGGVMSGVGTGTYTVNSDCTYSDEFTDQNTGLSFHRAGEITGQGLLQELNVIYTDESVVGIGTAKKMLPSPCSLATLKGTFGILELGSVVGVGPAALSGTATYDGKGTFSGTATLNFDGLGTAAGPYTATYTVSPDCTYSDEIPFQGSTSHRVGTIVGEGTNQAVQTIYTDPGLVALGTEKKQ